VEAASERAVADSDEEGQKVIKKISVGQLRVGMHVHEFCGSWMDHPFWRSKFMLRTEGELRRIVSGGVKELWIDTAKGADVEGGVSREDVIKEVERELEFVASMPFEMETNDSDEAALAQASALYRRSVPKIAALFGEARLGKAVDATACAALVDDISDSVLRNPGALISVARLKRRDEYTYMHSVAVCALMVSLGRQLGMQGDQAAESGPGGHAARSRQSGDTTRCAQQAGYAHERRIRGDEKPCRAWPRALGRRRQRGAGGARCVPAPP